jgi:simple sugar transport system permease protein
VPLGAALVAFAFAAIMILALGANPVEGLAAMVDGAFGTRERLAVTAVRAAPLLLVGAGITVAFRTKVINIGGEGQIVVGALLATALALAVPDLPRPILLPLVLVAGMVGGAVWGAIAGALKAYASVNEILSTIMLNLVAIQLMNYLLRGPMIDPTELDGSRIPQTQRLTDNAVLPVIWPDTRLHLGVLVAVVAAVLVWILLWWTPLGFRLRAVGHNPDAARASGISVEREIVSAMGISGSLSGLAGSVLVFGSEGVRMVTDGSTAGFTGSAGFNGIVAALFGGLHPLWTIPSSFLFGSLQTGANNLQRVLQIPSPLVVALNGIVVVFVVSSGRIRSWIEDRMAARADARSDERSDDRSGGGDPDRAAMAGADR